MSKLIVGFGCKRLRGKDTAAAMLFDMLANRHIEVRRDAFAATVKEVCQLVFGFTLQQVHTIEGKEAVDPFWGFTPRWALQTVGTEAFRRQIRDDVWVKVVERRHLLNDSVTILSDLRFENEALMVQRLGGIVIRVDRDIPFDKTQDQHASETGLDDFNDWDFVIDNNGTLMELKEQLTILTNGLEESGLL